MPAQICAGTVQRPLLADVWPSYTGPTIMPTHSLCGAQPDVQLHHEHVVTKSCSLEGCRGTFQRSGKQQFQRGFTLTEENCKNPIIVRSWILHQDEIQQLLKAKTVLRLAPPLLLLVELPVPLIYRHAHRGNKEEGESRCWVALMNVREWQIGCHGLQHGSTVTGQSVFGKKSISEVLKGRIGSRMDLWF